MWFKIEWQPQFSPVREVVVKATDPDDAKAKVAWYLQHRGEDAVTRDMTWITASPSFIWDDRKHEIA
jgi:hypothetical protein